MFNWLHSIAVVIKIAFSKMSGIEKRITIPNSIFFYRRRHVIFLRSWRAFDMKTRWKKSEKNNAIKIEFIYRSLWNQYLFFHWKLRYRNGVIYVHVNTQIHNKNTWELCYINFRICTRFWQNVKLYYSRHHT